MSILSTQTAKSTSHFSWIFGPMNNKLFIQAGIASAGWRLNLNGYELQRDKMNLEIRRHIQAIKGMRLWNNLPINGIMGSSNVSSFQLKVGILWDGAYGIRASEGMGSVAWHVLQCCYELGAASETTLHQVRDDSWSLCMGVCSSTPAVLGHWKEGGTGPQAADEMCGFRLSKPRSPRSSEMHGLGGSRVRAVAICSSVYNWCVSSI